MSFPLLRLPDPALEEILRILSHNKMLSMSFPLLRLPDVALKEVLGNLSLKEILFLVQTSLKARRRISLQRTPIEILVVDAERDFYIQISSDNKETFEIEIATLGVGPLFYWKIETPVRYEKLILESFWTRNPPGFQEVLDFLDNVFRIEVSVEIKPCNSSRALPIMEYIASKNPKMGTTKWWTFGGSDEKAERFLMASKRANKLNFKGFYSTTFNFNHFHLFRMDKLHIVNATWMTSDQLVALRNCKRVYLESVCLNAADISKVLQEYLKNGGKLWELRMFFPLGIDLEEAIKGLKVSRVEEENSVRAKKCWFARNNGIQISVTREWADIVVITMVT
uniref:F-box domain-containing protein n=1 Tax=Caenorhabditis tropicalis TaxID=1561998 RepID=A0A1I7UT79_9PELO